MQKSAVLYRGSSKQLDYFEPQPVHKTDKEKLSKVGVEASRVVWASPNKKHSLAFAALNGVSFELYTTEGNEKILQIIDLKWEDKLNLDKRVYLYHLPAKDFRKVNEREYVATKRVNWLKREIFVVREVLKMFPVYIPVIRNF